MINFLQAKFSPRALWVALFGMSALIAFALHSSYVFLQLSTVRPLLVFIFVNGKVPPICGLCFLL